jgi:hypothetical protein
MANAYSLHIGLNNVDPTHYDGWNGQLYCCENDALFYHELADKAGIKNRKLLLSSGSQSAEMPISANLDKYLEQFSKTLNSGDFLFITYSGHGGQIGDLNFDEEEDALDETWCLYDRQYVDDELWEHFSRFKKGVRILMISDSCHSGSVSKAALTAKDIEVDGLLQEISKKMNLVARYAPKHITFNAVKKNKEQYYGPTHKPIVIREDIPATVLLLAACRDEEKASEWDGYGLFTSTIKKVLTTDKAITNYEDWLEKILKQIPAIQTPTLFTYGSGADLFCKEKIFQINSNGTNPFSFFDPEQHAVPKKIK